MSVNITGGMAASGIAPVSRAVGANATYGSVSVGVTATLVLAANASRLSAVIVNNGSATMYFGTSSSVIVGSAGTALSGIPIPVGGSITFETYTGNIYAISGSAAQDARYLELTT